MNNERIPLTITLKPWFSDHHFRGRTILPAVETMALLASMAMKSYPGVDVRVMEQVRFPRFLEIPGDAATVAALCECHTDGDGSVCCKLLSRVRLKTMSRVQEHGLVNFPLWRNDCLSGSERLDWPEVTEPVTTIDADRIYRELVPFGPYYQTLQGKLSLAGTRAWGWLKAPMLPPEPVHDSIGSPFPLDGALHGACVLGQQSVDFVPFPVGFAQRLILRPTLPGATYRTRIVRTSQSTEELSFDLEIFDDEGCCYESVTGVRMRDVSGAMQR